MLKISKTLTDGILTVHCHGAADESDRFEQLIWPLDGNPPLRELHLFCKDISRINSIGVNHWISYFSKLSKTGIRLKLFECSTPIVEALNLILNFECGGSIESVCIPLFCQSCKTELISVVEVETLKKADLAAIKAVCTRCRGAVVFDEDPERYLSFLDRSK